MMSHSSFMHGLFVGLLMGAGGAIAVLLATGFLP